MVARFNVDYEGRMYNTDTGLYVKYDAYQQLEAELAKLKQTLQAISDLKHAAERPVIKLPPELEEHKSGLVGHRPTLQLKTSEWAEGYREAILDVSLINEVKYD